jgi:hypothetical protein
VFAKIFKRTLKFTVFPLFATVVVDTGGQFTAGIVDTGGNSVKKQSKKIQLK